MSVPWRKPGSGAFVPPVPSVGFPEAVHRGKEERPAMGGTLCVSTGGRAGGEASVEQAGLVRLWAVKNLSAHEPT
jgi:hypothetical protein